MSRRGKHGDIEASKISGVGVALHLRMTPKCPGGGNITRLRSGAFALDVGDGFSSTVVSGATVFCTREQLDEIMADLNEAYADLDGDR